VKRAVVLGSAVAVVTGAIARADTASLRSIEPPESVASSAVAELSETPQPVPAAVDNEPAIPAVDEVSFPVARSRPPDARQWARGQEVRLTRGAFRCGARTVREWIRLECSIPRIVRAHLIAGNRAGVDIRLADESRDGSFARAEITFPVRVGDRRVFQIVPLGSEWGDEGGDPVAISESWLEGEPPHIFMTGD
jgi:hypothetical protein